MKLNTFVKLRHVGTAAIAGALLLLSTASAQAQTLIRNYDLNGSLADSLGGPSLTNNGATLGPAGLTFAANQGPSLSGWTTSAQDASDYSIELRFSFDTTSGYRKILDFKDRTADAGLYNLSTALNFYPVTSGPSGVFGNGTLADVVLTRDGTSKLVTGYVNGVQQLSFTDSSDLAVFSGVGNIIQFLRDDGTTASEASGGFLDRIRIYNGALSSSQVADLAAGGTPPGGNTDLVPEPISVAMFLPGLAAAGLLKRRKRK